MNDNKIIDLISYRYERYLKREGYIVKKDESDNIKIAIRIKEKRN